MGKLLGLLAVIIAVGGVTGALAQTAGIDLRKVDEDNSTITLGWDAVPGATGYRFSREGLAKRPHTWNEDRITVRFGKGSSWYKVEALLPGPFGVYPPPDPPPDPPTLAVVFIAPAGSDANPCTAAEPCKSFQRGYEVAQPGDIVEASAGDYPFQQMRPDSSKTSPADVIIRPATGATVRAAGLRLGVPEENGSGPSHLTIRDITDARSPQAKFEIHGSNDITWINLDAANFRIDKSSNITIDGGDWGPCTVPSPGQACSNSKLDTGMGENITIRNATFHDYRIVPNSGEHFECLIIFSGKNIVIENNTFTDCEFYNIFIQHPAWAGYAGPDGTWPRDFRIENNVFTPVWENGVFGRRSSALAFSPRHVPFYNTAIICNEFKDGATISKNDDGDGTVYVNWNVVPLGAPSC